MSFVFLSWGCANANVATRTRTNLDDISNPPGNLTICGADYYSNHFYSKQVENCDVLVKTSSQQAGFAMTVTVQALSAYTGRILDSNTETKIISNLRVQLARIEKDLSPGMPLYKEVVAERGGALGAYLGGDKAREIPAEENQWWKK